MDENWATLWERVGERMPDTIAVVEGDRRVPWWELTDRASRLATGLAKAGVQKDSKVGFLAYNCAEYVEGAFAVFKLRGTPVNLSYRYLDDELVEVLDDCDAEVLLFHGALGDKVERIRERVPRLRAVVQIDDGAPLLPGALAYEDLIAEHQRMPPIPRSGSDLFMIYTGGTTGTPRGVVWRHRDLISTLAFPAYTMAGYPTPEDAEEAADSAVRMRQDGLTPVFLPASPLIHGTAFYLAKCAWLLGGTVTFLRGRQLDGHEIWRLVQAERVNQIAIVGDLFASALVQALDEADQSGDAYDISSVARITSSGVTWTAPWKQALLDRGRMMLADILGASEGGPFSVQIIPPGSRVEDCPFRLGERAKLIRQDGSVIPEGSQEVGMLAVSPPVPLGYYGAPAKSAELLREVDGVVHCVPGDYAYLDTNGEVVLLGRGALCINTGGEKVYPQQVEEVVLTAAGVLDVVVVGVPDERWTQAVTAVVSADPDADVTAGRIRDAVRARLAGYKVPKHVVFVDDVLRSPAGKAKYSWAAQVAAEAVTRASTAPA